MLRRIVLVVVVLAAAGLEVGPAGSAAASPESAGSGPGWSPPAVTAVRTVTLDLQCAAVEEVTVSARLPRTVGTGQAFTIAELTTTQKYGVAGTIHLGLTNTTTDTLSFAQDELPHAVQVVATGRPGQRVEIRVSGAMQMIIHDSYPPMVSRIDCTPVGDDRLGSVLIGRFPRRGAATGAVDTAVPVDCTDAPGYDMGGSKIRVSFTAPTTLRTGGTFTLPDLGPGPGDPWGTTLVRIPAVGTDRGADSSVNANTVQTVTAAPGQTVDIYVAEAVSMVNGIFYGACEPQGNGHLASIPVIATDR